MIPLTAIYAPKIPGGYPSLLHDRQELERFLATPENYPMFGKPEKDFRASAAWRLAPSDRRNEKLKRQAGTALRWISC